MAFSGPLVPHTLAVAGLACRRGDRTLFAGIDFTLGPGEVLLVRGANGAGKTTLLMTLAGVLRPLEGAVTISGPEPDRPAGQALCLLGYQNGFKGQLSVLENLGFWARLYGSERLEAGPDWRDALDIVGLAALADLATANLSAGQLRRLSLARLLVSHRPIWLLDEPAATLDAAGEALLGSLLTAHLARGGLAVAAIHHDLALAPATRHKTLTLTSASRTTPSGAVPA